MKKALIIAKLRNVYPSKDLAKKCWDFMRKQKDTDKHIEVSFC